MIVSRLAHVALDVADLDSAIAFSCELFGLAPLAHGAGSAHLGAGASDTYELVLRTGDEPRIDHFAFALCGEPALVRVRERLARAGAPIGELTEDLGPGIAAAIETALPSGHALRLVCESAPRGFRPRPAVPAPHHRGVGGPLRAPQQRITAAQMTVLRAGASAAGLPVTSDPDELFWVGRHPA